MKILELFPELTLNPASSKEIKQWILQLAIEGRLTEKWRDTNSLKRQNWEATELGALVNLTMGQAPPGNECNLNEVGTPFVKVGQFREVRPETNEWTTKPLKLVTKDHVLICVVGATIGKINLGIECAIGRSVAGLLPNKVKLDQLFLYCFLKTWVAKFQSISRGSAQGVINKDQLNGVPISLPPLEEQKAIVTIVEDLFKEVDLLEAQTKQRIALKRSYAASALERLTNADTPAKWQQIVKIFPEIFNDKETIKMLRETVLQLAVQGKLTAKWRAKNPALTDASVLLKEIQEEKARLVKEKKIKAEKPLPAIKEDEIPFELPKGWVWCRMQEIGLFDRGKSKHRPRNDSKLFVGGQYPLVQTGDVSSAKNTSGQILSHKTEYNDFGLSQSRIWGSGTLCITIAANIAETGFLTYDACFPDSVVGFKKIIGDYLPQYVEFFISITKSDLEKFAPSTAQKNINLGILYELKFPLCPLAEQQVIVEKVKTLFELLDTLELETTSLKKQSEQLVSAVTSLESRVESNMVPV